MASTGASWERQAVLDFTWQPQRVRTEWRDGSIYTMSTDVPLSKANYKVEHPWEQPTPRVMLRWGPSGTVYQRQPYPMTDKLGNYLLGPLLSKPPLVPALLRGRVTGNKRGSPVMSQHPTPGTFISGKELYSIPRLLL